MVRPMLLMIPVLAALAGCDRGPAPAAASSESPETRLADAPGEASARLVEMASIVRAASFDTSPPTHPELPWPELAPVIEDARLLLAAAPMPVKPAVQPAPLSERSSAAQFAQLRLARDRALIHRAEAARLIAAGYPDAAVDELALAVDVANALASWGVPAAAERSSEIIFLVLGALEQPLAAPLAEALSGAARRQMQGTLAGLDDVDPAGRLRAMVESADARFAALAELARGPDGPAPVRAAAARYRRGVVRSEPQQIDRAINEARAFARALADGWDRPTRSAITERLRKRQDEDSSGVLQLTLGDAADACDADARLREHIALVVERLQ